MERKLRTYQGTGITVTFDARRCIHEARCIGGLPEVFEPGRRPWIDPDRAPDVQALMRVIETCPSGALQYQREGSSETPAAGTSVTVSVNGPLFLRGDLTVSDGNGTVLETGSRFALCRCGASGHKPFCDGSHKTVGFRDGEA